MKKVFIFSILLIFIISMMALVLSNPATAQEDNGVKVITPTPAETVNSSPTPAHSPAPSIDAEKLMKLFNSMSQMRVYIEFFFMESGDYPETLVQLNQDLNSILPGSLQKVVLPKDPATGKDFIYTRSKDQKSYTLSVPDPSVYGMNKIELPAVEWGGFRQIAQDRKYKFLAMICIENIKAIATAVEYYAKDKGKFPTTLKDLVPKYLKSMPVCPIDGDFYEYKVEGSNYYIKCPNAREHQMSELMFSSKRGWVTK